MTYFEKHLFKPIRLFEKPSNNTGLIIVIPCFNEPDVCGVLSSLNSCETCTGSVEVIIVINAPENASAEVISQNEKSFQEIISWQKCRNPFFQLFVLRDEELPPKHAGVGLARKIGMDEAAWRFESIMRNGVIVCLDADCEVAPNYLSAIEDHFSVNPSAKAASIYFEHPLDIPDKRLRTGIINYELHLRYYVQALRYAGYPYAFHTIGSSMCVKSKVYQSSGGMNRRKAGEDFYFLHKIIPLGGFGVINTTTVYPSPRVSHRVPFGTGRAMSGWLEDKQGDFFTYDIRIFEELKALMQLVPLLYNSPTEETVKLISGLPQAIGSYLKEADFPGKIDEINHHTASMKTFSDRVFNWMDGFRVLKMIHYIRDHSYPNILVEKAANQLLKKLKPNYDFGMDLISCYRKMDRSADTIL